MAAFVLSSFVVFACGDKIETGGEPGGDTPGGDGEIVVVDGKVNFSLSLAGIPDEFFNCGILSRDLSDRTVRVGSKDYPVKKSDGGGYYVQVDESPFGTYSAVLLGAGSDSFHGSSPYLDILLPRTIFPSEAGKYADIPLFCEWGEEDGAVLKFAAPYALLNLKCESSSAIVSANISSDSPLSGTFSFIRSQNRYDVTSSRSRVVVNCTEYPNQAAGIPVLLLPGVDAQLDVRLCDASGLMSEHQMNIALGAGDAKTVKLEHKPADNLLFYDGFDRCVWGGNPVDGTEGVSPWTVTGSASGGADCSGYEDAPFSCGSSSAGAGYVQSSFRDAKPSVEEQSYMSASYVRSRGFDNYRYLLRVQEYDGCIAAGIPELYRGWVRIKPFASLEGISDVTVKFRICPQPGFSDVVVFSAYGGGVITAAKVDGKDFSTPDYLTHAGVTSNFLMSAGDLLNVPTSFSAGMAWQDVELTIRGASETTLLSWLSQTNGERINGFWLDDITVEKVEGSWNRNAAGSLRIMSWNIQNGMWADQGYDYDNFVAEVKKYSPDICLWCEGRSNNVTDSDASNPDPYLKNDVSASSGWAALAARYGHKYLGVSYRSGDNYPQVVTSRYPITRVLMLGKVGSTTITHSSGMFSIDCGGTQINLVSVHLQPYSGEDYDAWRLKEITQILSSTILSSEYSGRSNWIFAGDFNSKSHYDKSYYTDGDSAFGVHQYIAEHSDLVDLMHATYPDRLISSTTGDASGSRIDYMYLSPALYSRVTDACTVVDTWAAPVLTATGLSNFRLPSDHRPLLVQFDLK